MEQSSPESRDRLAAPESDPQLNLDSIFSTFFQKLEKLPPVNKPRSARDYIESNREQIIHALSKGYTYSDLAELLKECGFPISASTLRRYVGRVKGKKGEPIEPEAGLETATDSSGFSAKLSHNAPTTPSDYQPKLRPRRN